ncbi:metal-dependent hydrolase [Terasakiella sp. A23]|uniref:metal-dependent hydrolase n=1 Tax=Terasakiella sp. FCG-A23 TaxID=3080561 RepID=UPI0029538B14|nr:metal-dependent hydrolase [Terasakiella sp. A23]MDV7340919.1 metal-dependent hydrolase [Terasakiella sp. A23]
MDPVTQGVIGAVVPQATRSKKHLFLAALFGWIAGMTPDLDTFIRSDHDPLLYLEYHRQFTHSLIFVPVGGLICGSLLYLFLGKRWGLSFKQSLLFCTLGYATHGLLDAATSYGTMLFWPFSDLRVAWSFISIIDPLFTLPILILVILAAWKDHVRYSQIALGWMVLYLSFGALQNFRATQAGLNLITQRDHEARIIDAKPSFGNLMVWKVIYREGDTYHVDAVRTGWNTTIFEGTTIKALDIDRDFPWLDKSSTQAKDIERFRWFSKGFIAKDPIHENRIIDLRYSIVPNEINALWSIKLSKEANHEDHARFITHRRAGPAERKILLDMIFN